MSFDVTITCSANGLTPPAQPRTGRFIRKLVVGIHGLVKIAATTVAEQDPILGQGEHERLLLFVPLHLTSGNRTNDIAATITEEPSSLGRLPPAETLMTDA